MRERTDADDTVQRAAIGALLELILPPMRIAARRHGYALTVHGSLCRDIDLVAIPWVERCDPKEALVQTLCGAISGITGSCLQNGEWAKKPHGRAAATLIAYCAQQTFQIDLSVLSLLQAKETP